ncbi:hypothetical protein NPX13_g614 [Xylaria arbuscula]|uniref:Mitochondrial K+-H+ exchange-related-domain-containing protein n=1 Tax=Xylaria arbuscula TaxID=114810 RepID=A0A9W8NP20_9PEZI|nr:hypothetical protein NPX13_g614 [Xylaria arbuscula]
MRLFLLPISTRRTLLYCQKLQALPSEKQPWVDKITLRAAKLWADWEKKESGWQKSVVKYGNTALRRIPYEEWGLKSVPTLSARRREEEILGKEKHHLIFPQSVIPAERAPEVLRVLATEREGLHRSRMIWCFIGMPISAPFALVPIIPNLPFFYLVYRAWSHYRAIAGGKHLQWLLTKNFFSMSPSKTLDAVYSRNLLNPLEKSSSPDSQPSDINQHTPERMLLTQETGRQLARSLELPALEVELERAIWQVENAIQKQKQEEASGKAQSSSEPKQDISGKE